MPASHPKPKARPAEPSWHDGLIEEFLAWIEVDHEDWHRRMAKLHEDLEQAHRASRVRRIWTW
jgi:hypothetical protein